MPLAKRRSLNEQSFVMPAAAHRAIPRVFGSWAAGRKIRDRPPPLTSVPSPRGAEQNGTLWAGGVCVALKGNVGNRDETVRGSSLLLACIHSVLFGRCSGSRFELPSY